MNSKGKEGKARDWEQPSSPAGKAALVTGQVHSPQKPDLGAHASVAPTFVQTPERLQDVRAARQGCCEVTGRSGPSELSLAEDYCMAAGGFLLRNNPQQIEMVI